MRSLALSLLFFLLATQPVRAESAFPDCPTYETIAEHMQGLALIADKIFAFNDEPARDEEMSNLVGQMRCHMYRTMGMVPPSISALPAAEKNIKLMDYQALQADMMVYMVELERTWRSKPTTYDGEQKKRQRLSELLMKVQKIMGLGHEKFRK